MTRRLVLYAAIGVLVYAVGIVAMAPASWIARRIGDASDERLTLRSPQGSAWAGDGQLFARARQGTLVELGRVRWVTAPTSLVTGRLAADVFLDDRPGMRVELTPGTVVLRGLDIEFSARLLGELAPGLETFGPEGRVRIRAESLRLDRDSVLGQADVEWRGARLARAQGLELGSHVARLHGGGAKVDIEVATLEGPLRLHGAGTWTRDKGLAFAGTAEPEPGPRSGELAPFLKSVCSEYRDGRCGFRYAP